MTEAVNIMPYKTGKQGFSGGEAYPESGIGTGSKN